MSFGKRKDGQAYPKTKKSGTKKAGSTKSSGKKIKLTEFGWSYPAFLDVITRRKQRFKRKYGNDIHYNTKRIDGGSMEMIGTVKGKTVDHFIVEKNNLDLFLIRDLM